MKPFLAREKRTPSRFRQRVFTEREAPLLFPPRTPPRRVARGLGARSPHQSGSCCQSLTRAPGTFSARTRGTCPRAKPLGDLFAIAECLHFPRQRLQFLLKTQGLRLPQPDLLAQPPRQLCPEMQPVQRPPPVRGSPHALRQHHPVPAQNPPVAFLEHRSSLTHYQTLAFLLGFRQRPVSVLCCIHCSRQAGTFRASCRLHVIFESRPVRRAQEESVSSGACLP